MRAAHREEQSGFALKLDASATLAGVSGEAPGDARFDACAACVRR